MIVLDASAALELLLNAGLSQQVADRVFRSNESLHVPHLIDLEISQVLRRLVRRDDITLDRAAEVFEDLNDLHLTRYPHNMLLPQIWALRNNATAYDAAYLALAQTLDAPLLTCDQALHSIAGFDGQVEVIQ